jgi:hypothetical protein
VSSNRDKLNDRIRRTIRNLRDEDLIHVAHSKSGEYTQFAIKVAKAEVEMRGGENELWERVKQQPRKSPGHDEFINAALLRPPDARPSTGCYIELWRDKNFEGECLTIEGPGEIGDLCSNHMSWCGSIRSLRVGPHAFVLAYADQEFKGKMISLGPGEELADLGNIKFDDEIDSIRIVDSIKVFDCTSSPDHHVPEQAVSENEGYEHQGPEIKASEVTGDLRQGKPKQHK